MIEAAKRAPGAIPHASSGQGSIYHAVFVLLSRAANIELLHVPFTGGAPSLQALMANTVELAVLAPEEMAGLANAGDWPLYPSDAAGQNRGCDLGGAGCN